MELHLIISRRSIGWSYRLLEQYETFYRIILVRELYPPVCTCPSVLLWCVQGRISPMASQFRRASPNLLPHPFLPFFPFSFLSFPFPLFLSSLIRLELGPLSIQIEVWEVLWAHSAGLGQSPSASGSRYLTSGGKSLLTFPRINWP